MNYAKNFANMSAAMSTNITVHKISCLLDSNLISANYDQKCQHVMVSAKKFKH